MEEQENLIHKRNDEAKKSTSRQMNPKPKANAPSTSTSVAIPSEISADLQALDDKVKSMMEKGQKMIPCGGKQANGRSKQTKSYICIVCGKEGYFTLIRDHIEHNHIEEISIPCCLCDKTFSSRMALSYHKSRYHK